MYETATQMGYQAPSAALAVDNKPRPIVQQAMDQAIKAQEEMHALISTLEQRLSDYCAGPSPEPTGEAKEEIPATAFHGRVLQLRTSAQTANTRIVRLLDRLRI